MPCSGTGNGRAGDIGRDPGRCAGGPRPGRGVTGTDIAGPEDEGDVSGVGRCGGLDDRPRGGPIRPRGRLDEAERVVAEEGPSDRDLGDGAGAGGRFLDQPGREGVDDDLIGGSPSPRASSTLSNWSARARPARVEGSDGKPDERSGATTSGPEPTRIAVPARTASRWAKAWSDRARSGSTTPPTISDIASDPMTSIRSKAATTAASGAPSVGETVAMRT